MGSSKPAPLAKPDDDDDDNDDDDAVELRTVHINDAAQNAQFKFTCVRCCFAHGRI